MPLAEVSAWGNGFSSSDDYPQYGVHDAVADYAYRKLMGYNLTVAQWITDWYKSGETNWGSGVDAYLAWTDDPDSVAMDWENHNYEVHGTQRGAPNRVQQLFQFVVGNLSNWMKNGRPYRSNDEKMAVYSAGLLTHYYADVSQFMHTDDSSSHDPEHQHPSYGPKSETYHGYYESAAIGDTFLDKLTADLNASVFKVDEYRVSWSERVEELAVYVNSHNGSTRLLPDSSTVGVDYYRMLYQYVRQYDEGTTYLGARGWDESLYNESLRYVRWVTGNLTQLFYSAYKAAENNAELPPINGGTLPLTTLIIIGGVLIVLVGIVVALAVPKRRR